VKLDVLACQSQGDVKPESGGFDPVSGFAFFVEAAAVDVVYDRDGHNKGN
jgi:hypothetical protein